MVLKTVCFTPLIYGKPLWEKSYDVRTCPTMPCNKHFASHQTVVRRCFGTQLNPINTRLPRQKVIQPLHVHTLFDCLHANQSHNVSEPAFGSPQTNLQRGRYMHDRHVIATDWRLFTDLRRPGDASSQIEETECLARIYERSTGSPVPVPS